MHVSLKLLLIPFLSMIFIPAYADIDLSMIRDGESKQIFEMDDVLKFRGNADELKFINNGNIMEPVEITIKNKLNHIWDIVFYPTCENAPYPDCDVIISNDIQLSSDVGFTEGIYNVQTQYGDEILEDNFIIGSQFTYDLYLLNQNNSDELDKSVDDDCIFTANLEKSWIYYNESPWVRGVVLNCDAHQIQDVDIVYVKLLDINGDRIDRVWLGQDHLSIPSNPSHYEYAYSVYRGGANGNVFHTDEGLVKINTNQYFFEMPSISSLEFNHREIYQIELTYGDQTQNIFFAVFNPNIPYWEDEDYVDSCNDYQNKIIQYNNSLDAIKRDADILLAENRIEKFEGRLDAMKVIEQKIEELNQCS